MSIRYREDREKWELSFVENGKRKRLLFRSKREAQDFKLSDEPVSANARGITDAVQFYYKNVSETKSRSSRSAEKNYLSLMNHFLCSELGLTYLVQVRYGHMLAFQRWLSRPQDLGSKKFHLSFSSVNRAFNSIKHFYVYWVRDGELTASPCAHLERLAADENERRPMTREEFEKAFEKCADWFKPAMLFMHSNGAPAITLERLRWSDVDFENGTVTLSRKKGSKAKMRRDVVPMSDSLAAILNTQDRRHEFVFSNQSGRPLSAGLCSRESNKAIRAAGLPSDLVAYCMRHGLGSDLTGANVPLQTVSKLLGHANIRTTQRYAKPPQESLAVALRLVRPA